MSGDLVLITGATGLIGFRVLVEALEAGFRVRAAVRSLTKAEIILSSPTVKRMNPGTKLTFVVVTDILTDGAYDEAVKGVKFIIHVASPVVQPEEIKPENFESQLIQPAIKGTVGILTSAAKTTGIKRIVITSSMTAVISFMDMAVTLTDKIFDGSMRVPADNGPYRYPIQAYTASKAKALLATDAFFANNDTEFDYINILPSFVIGKSELTTEPKDITYSSNGVVMRQVLGVSNPMPMPGTTVYLNDIAKIHVLALDSKIKGNQSFMASANGSDGIAYSDTAKIVQKHFSKEVENGLLPNNGTQPTKSVKLDSSEAEKVFGIKFASYEEQVQSVVGHYIDIVGAKA